MTNSKGAPNQQPPGKWAAISPASLRRLRTVVATCSATNVDSNWRSATHFAAALEGVSKAEIGLDKIVVNLPTCMINEVIASLTEDPNMGSKAIFKSTADVPERATLDAPRYAVEPLIELRKLSVYRLLTPASENTTEPNETVWRQVNTRPEVIQREPQYNVGVYDTRGRTDRATSARRPDSVDSLSHSESSS